MAGCRSASSPIGFFTGSPWRTIRAITGLDDSRANDLRAARRKVVMWYMLWSLCLASVANGGLTLDGLPVSQAVDYTVAQRNAFVKMTLEHCNLTECLAAENISSRTTRLALSRIFVPVQLQRSLFNLVVGAGQSRLYEVSLAKRHRCHRRPTVVNGTKVYYSTLTFFVYVDVPPLCTPPHTYFQQEEWERRRFVPGKRILDQIGETCPATLRASINSILANCTTFSFSLPKQQISDDEDDDAYGSADVADEWGRVANLSRPCPVGMATGAPLSRQPPQPPSSAPPHDPDHLWLECVLATRSIPCHQFLPPSLDTPAPCPTGETPRAVTSPSNTTNTTTASSSNDTVTSPEIRVATDDGIAGGGNADTTDAPVLVTTEEPTIDDREVLCKDFVNLDNPPADLDCSKYTESVPTSTAPLASSREASSAASTTTRRRTTPSNGTPTAAPVASESTDGGVDDAAVPQSSDSLSIASVLYVVLGVALAMIALTFVLVSVICYRSRHSLPVRQPKKGTESEEQTVQGDELEEAENAIAIATARGVAQKKRTGSGEEFYV
ncbi:uncharacterized protein LOC135819485 isoform X2 [Sycon ciliatum]|uniref:uncharacterized protein LOC135819485 isoform X2 n=1 Tax=Sycon ciliatum TaxID=27933 RepID=UPI0031F6842F